MRTKRSGARLAVGDAMLDFKCVVFAAMTFTATACSSASSSTTTSPTPDAGEDAARSTTAPPTNHRATAAACPTTRASNPAPAAVAGSPCSADADCTAGKNGRCYGPALGGSGTLNFCSYDACTDDADCSSPRVCDCRNAANYGANVCFNGDCQTDKDCGSGGFCSPSLVDLGSNCVGVPAGSVGYFCHVPTDECTNDTDCASGSGLGKCSFDVSASHWKCYAARCTG